MTGKSWARFHLVGIIFMLVLWAIATYTDLVSSVKFISHVSMLALVLAEFAAWQGAKAEKAQEDDN